MRIVELERVHLGYCTYAEAKQRFDFYTALGCTTRLEGYELVFERAERQQAA